MVSQIYSAELQSNKANYFATEAPYFRFGLVHNYWHTRDGIVSSKLHDTRDGFNFDIAILQFLDGDVTRSASYSQLIRLCVFNIRK